MCLKTKEKAITTPINATLVFLLLLSGCGRSDNWTVSHIQTGKTAYDSSKLTYATHDPVNGLDVEIFRIENETRTYVQVHFQAIPPYQGNPKEALVTLYIDKQPLFGVAARHEGGQRLLLSPELQTALFQALQENKNVTIQLEGFSATIQSENFEKRLAEIGSPPFRNPFRLPMPL